MPRLTSPGRLITAAAVSPGAIGRSLSLRPSVWAWKSTAMALLLAARVKPSSRSALTHLILRA